MVARYLIASVLLLVGTARAVDTPPECGHNLISTETMYTVVESIKGYDTSAVINQSRFVADFLFGLARMDDVPGATGSFQIQPRRFFRAWLDATGTSAEDAPVSMRKVLEFNQRFVVDTRAAVELSSDSPEARQMLAVHVSWPAASRAADHYSYEDTMADPSVRLRHDRVITYTLIDFGHFVAFEDMMGIHGKPTSGGLGALFSFLGTARILSSRFAVADDQTQVNRSRVRKLFSFSTLTTITPDGTATRGIPDDRADLQVLADRLEADIEIEMHSPWPKPCN